MKWKFKVDVDDDQTWTARALPSVGGRYQVYTEWQGNFRVAYEDPGHGHEWRVLEGSWLTDAEAKAAAEADNVRRRAIKKAIAAHHATKISGDVP